MEKHDWNERLGRQVMESYERVLPVSEVERQVLYYLFLYPEKYWKQINFYYNANKAGAREEYGEDQKAGGSAGGEGELYTDSYSRRVRKKPGDRNYG